MTEQAEDDLWIGTCGACGHRYQIFDAIIVDAYPHLMLQLDDADEFLAHCDACPATVVLTRQIAVVKPFSSWTVLPPATGCPMCGVEHPPELPHDWQMLLYQYTFRSAEAQAGRPERWPTIRDAMAHCTPDVQQVWIDALEKRGVVVS